MKKFKFNLAVLLKIRKRYEERIIQEFSDQQRRVMQQEAIKEQLLLVRSKKSREYKMFKTGTMDMVKDKAYDQYLTRLQKDISQAEQHLGMLKQELETLRQRLVRARKEVSALEKLKEQRWDQHQQALSKEEQRLLDEVAINHAQDQRTWKV